MRSSRFRLITVLLAVVALTPLSARAQSDQRCFTETSFCISGRIREFWEKNGGLPVFGFPIGAQQLQTIEGKSVQAQNFERNRLELHPENTRPYDVLLGRLGADRLGQLGKDWQTYPKSGAQPGCRFFTETGQNVCGTILRAWRASGLEIDNKSGKTEAENLALFGLPLSPLVTEKQADGQDRQIQWFERARFEIHPENQAPYDVLLGLLGNEIRDGAKTSAPTQPAANGCADVPDSVSARLRPGKCIDKGTRIEIDIFGFQPNEQIGFWVTAPNGALDGTVETLSIGPTGLLNGLPLDTNDYKAGLWTIVFEGVSSKHQSIIYFKVNDPNAQAPVNNGPRTLPQSQNAMTLPEQGPTGTVFQIIGRGFTPGEQVGAYATRPDKSVNGAPFQVTAEDDGTVGVTFTTSTQSQTGVWAYTFEGVDSGRKAIAYFEVTK
jgi:hypothetical protein